MIAIRPLKQRQQFVRLTAKGYRWGTPAFVLQAASTVAMNKPLACYVGFTVTKKTGSAVQRNRIRRRLRALVQKEFPLRGHAGVEYVLIGRKDALQRPFALMEQDMQQALHRIHQKISKESYE